MTRYVYAFEEGDGQNRQLLGGKGAGLAEMSKIGLPVPPGFTITTEACNAYQSLGRLPDGLMEQVWDKLAQLEAKLGKKLGDPERPLLVSVRSGAPISMPGMMDTVLNLGLNPETTEGLARLTQNRRFALDSYRRFIQMFGNVVLHMEHSRFEHLLDRLKQAHNIHEDTQLTEEHLTELIRQYKELVVNETGKPFPDDAKEQLTLAIVAVFDSWKNPRAVVYRRLNKISEDLGTAVNVQSMVFGNMGDTSATGVLFTRNPNTGGAGDVRRISYQRSGRRRRGGYSDAQTDSRNGPGDAPDLPAADGCLSATGIALSRYARYRVYRGRYHALYFANPER